MHAKTQINVDGTTVTGYDVQGEFISPTAVGTWPAFWLTAVSGWPPEADIGEWKGELPKPFCRVKLLTRMFFIGTKQNWFNTFK